MEHSCTNRRHGTQAHTKEKRYTGTHIRRRGKHRHIQRHDTQGFDPISMLHSTILESVPKIVIVIWSFERFITILGLTKSLYALTAEAI